VSTVIGLDHGARRIGVAVGDTETGMAFARPAIHRRTLAVDLHEVEQLAWAEGAELVVVGLPLNMDGSEGDQAAAARAFGDGLTESGLRVAYTDERLSSWEAGEQLRAGGRRPPRRESGELDSAAARLILQQYLDARRRTPPPEETA
jgi:putative Holliday junction resolvase